MKSPNLILTALISTCIAPAFATAKTISTPEKKLVIDAGNVGKRVCYYNDKAYSKGAILQIGDRYIICKEENDFERNGALSWQVLKKEQNDR